MLADIKSQLKLQIIKSLQEVFTDNDSIPPIDIDIPADLQHGDFSSNIALKSAKVLRKSPMAIAEMFVPFIEKAIAVSTLKDKILKIEIKQPGFINFYLANKAMYDVVYDALEKDSNFGKSDIGNKEKILVEFVSANPTGPLSVAHARQAAVGDSLVNIFNFLGYEAKKEYYINDGGNQIKMLGESFRLRMLEILGEEIIFPEECYQGEYIKDMAPLILEEMKSLAPDEKEYDVNWLKSLDHSSFESFGSAHILNLIKKELEDFRVNFDVWTEESKVSTKAKIKELLKELDEKDLTYEKEGALWFKTMQLGDDKDRVLRKSDKTYTYLTPDIVYHKDKYERGFETLIDILGPDHHGYIPRLKAAAQALGKDPESLHVEIVQLATIYRSGKKVSMSTRSGQYISLREVMDEVGVDAARFFFLMRHMSVHLEFDLELAKKETSENPVFYIQYAYARINSINVKAKESGVKKKLSDFSKLNEPAEIELIKKISGFNDALKSCRNKIDPFPLANYLQSFASSFHKFYDTHKVLCSDDDLSSERLSLINASRVVLENGLKLLGLNAPQRM